MNTTDLFVAVEQSWAADTSNVYDLDWSLTNPANGQCAITSLVVQDYLDGDLLRTRIEGVSHYYNRLPNGAEVDLTRSQFGRWFATKPELRERDYVLSFHDTRRRYHLLRTRVAVLIGDPE